MKKWMIIVLLAILLSSVFIASDAFQVTGDGWYSGDMNGDSRLNSADVRYLALYIVGNPAYSPLHSDGDVNSDGQLNSADLRYLALNRCGDPDYTPLYPQASIQGQIDSAEDYAVITLGSGVFGEKIIIDKPITLIGKGMGITTIRTDTGTTPNVIKIQSTDVIIKDITIINDSDYLYATGVKIVFDNAKIIDCSFEDTPIGIVTWCDNCEISGCCFDGCDDEGIALLTGSSNNYIYRCDFENCCDGIELQDSCDNEISNCIINHNTHAGISIMSGCNDNLIKNCEICNNIYGIWININNNRNEIVNCIIEDNLSGNVVYGDPS